MKTRSLALMISLSLLGLASGTVLAAEQPVLGVKDATLIEQAGLQFKDLNKDGQLTPYEDWRLTPNQRARDLVSHMTLAEKAGLMMHGSAPSPESIIGTGTEYDIAATTKMMVDEKVNTFITRLVTVPEKMAAENNKLQAIAEQSRLGIPVQISADPRSNYDYVLGQPESRDGFSKWPETLGIAAIGSESLVKTYADIIRQEYRLLGISQALSPMADLATEPRWSRIAGTFGEDPQLVKRMVRGYIEGMQNGKTGLNQGSVSAVVKHWVGYGAAENGFDGHSIYGRYANFPNNNLAEHIIPFTGAFEVNVAGIMPTYSILKELVFNGQSIEQVGAGFNRYLLQDLLRDTYGFRGVIVSDWAITNDCTEYCITGHPAGEQPDPAYLGMPWGVESLSQVERFAKAINAGIDQFGGVTDITPIIQAVEQSKVSEARLDESAIRLLEQRFALGLFENPYVDVAKAETLPDAQWQELADRAQRDSLVLLENKSDVLPLKKGSKAYLYGIDPRAAQAAGLIVVASPAQADVAIFRTVAPFEQPHANYFFGAKYHEGSLAFAENHPDRLAIAAAAQKVPTIVTVYLDRPAILTPFSDQVSVLIGNFGVSDKVLFTALTSGEKFVGKLPFELPSSMESVLQQHSDTPQDSAAPLYPFGFGLQ